MYIVELLVLFVFPPSFIEHSKCFCYTLSFFLLHCNRNAMIVFFVCEIIIRRKLSDEFDRVELFLFPPNLITLINERRICF
jgi:hypothetical protein